MKRFLGIILAFIIGFGVIYGLLTYSYQSSSKAASTIKTLSSSLGVHSRQVFGFLPYWLISRADPQNLKYITTLAYFGLTVQPDGTIKQYDNPGESEPGWYALTSGAVDAHLSVADRLNLRKSLVVFAGSQEDIGGLIDNPRTHAATLIAEVGPIMKQYGFSDLNLDIESIEDASDSARANFIDFVDEVRNIMKNQKLGTLSLDASPTDLVKKRLIDIAGIAPYIDTLILMTYDYHYTGSVVTGAVAPVYGAGISAEFDTETGVLKALEAIDRKKILLGVPLYGYQWETLSESTRSATLPGSGIVVSNRHMEEFLDDCATCSARFDTTAQERYVIYKDDLTDMFYQAFFPDRITMENKIDQANRYDIAGIALWALGYEGKTILEPLEEFKKTVN